MNSEGSSTTTSAISCVKCTEGDGSFFRLENTKLAGYCIKCFPKVIQHKFASSLGRNRVFKTPEQRNALLVLVLFEDLVDSVELNKQLNLLKIFLIKQKFYSQWNWRFGHLAAIFNKFEDFPKEFERNEGIDGEENLEKFSNLISNCRSPSVRIELLRLIRTKLLSNYAAYFNFPSVLLSENADQLATETINSLCFGRGSSVFDISSVIDDRLSPNSLPFVNHSIQFIRPLRDISYKELEALDRIESGENIEENGINTRINGIIKEENSVQSLAKDFIESLRDNGFPATISTILSVSSKIESERNGQICTLCFGRFQIEEREEIKNKSCLFLLKICQPCLSIFEDIENEGINLLQEIDNL
uniref:Cytoplasmic tRNA 2-thiolation protein 2 n=1 Tax=Meloidogyne floridensis TaxID=298350 RepID=A0A915NXK2_9BILA